MLKWAVIFPIIALIVGLLGFTTCKSSPPKVQFAVFLIGFLLIVPFGLPWGSRTVSR